MFDKNKILSKNSKYYSSSSVTVTSPYECNTRCDTIYKTTNQIMFNKSDPTPPNPNLNPFFLVILKFLMCNFKNLEKTFLQRKLARGRLVVQFPAATYSTLVIKTGSYSSTAKHSAINVSVTGPRRWPL